MPLTRFEECCSWTPLKPQHSNPNPNSLAYQLWFINFFTPPSQSLCPPWILFYSKTDARFMQDAPKVEWSIPYVSVAFFQVSNIILLHIVLLKPWQSSFSRVYSSCCCCCSFEAEIIKIGQSSHKMYEHTEFSKAYDNFK